VKKDAQRRRSFGVKKDAGCEEACSAKKEARQRRTFGVKKNAGCEEGCSAKKDAWREEGCSVKKAAHRRSSLVEGGSSAKKDVRR